MSISLAAAAKRGKKFKDVRAMTPREGERESEKDDYLLHDAAVYLLKEHAWLREINAGLMSMLGIADQLQKRLHGVTAEVGSVRIVGVGPTLQVRDKLTDHVVRTWDYAEIAAQIGSIPTPQGTKLSSEKQLELMGLLSTTTPAGIIAHDPSVDHAKLKGPRVPAAALSPPHRTLAKQVATGLMIPLAQLQRHPENRKPAEAAIAERAASLKEDGQLEEAQVRQIADGKYQIVSGETRFLAAKLLKWTELRCTVIECDDAEALRLVGLYNGQRTDLNPIQKAQHIETMCSAGSSREEAARCVGLESGSAASNLVRLLKLPKVWQERVANGELVERWARSLLPLIPIEAGMKELEADWSKRDKPGYWNETFANRESLEETIGQLIEQNTRRLDDTKRSYRGQYYHELGSSHDAMGDYPCLLAADEIEANRAKLKIVTIVDGGKEVEVATNVKLFDTLQCAIIKQRHAAKGKSKAAAAGKQAAAGEREKPKSAAELKQAAEDRARQLQRSIADWRERLLRRELQRSLLEFKPAKQFDTRLLKLVLFYFCDHLAGTRLSDQLPKILGVAAKGRQRGGDVMPLLTPMLDVDTAHFRWQKVAAELCAYLVNGDADFKWQVELTDETLQALFDEWKCDLTAAWRKLHAGKDPLLEEFFELHRKDELRTLAKEVVPDLHLAETLGKSQMLKLILGRTLPPAVPKCLLPAKQRETKPAGKRGRK